MTSSSALVEQLASLRAVSRILQMLTQFDARACVALTNLVVLTLTRSVSVSRAVLEEFETCDGYSLLASAAVWMDQNSDAPLLLRTKFVRILSRLFFLGAAQERQGNNVVTNPIAFRMLLWVMTKIKDPQVVFFCWTLLEDAISSSYPELQEIEPFRLVFEQFDFLPLSERQNVLKTLRATFRSSNLLLPELRAMIALFQTALPSSVLLVCDFLRSLLADSILHPLALLPARIIPNLLRMLVSPHELPFASTLPMAEKELQACLSLRGIDEEPVDGEEMEDEDDDDEDEDANADEDMVAVVQKKNLSIASPNTRRRVSIVSECLLRRVLALLWELIRIEPMAFLEFQQEGGIRKLLDLSSRCAKLRTDLFLVLIGTFSCDFTVRQEIVPALMEILRSAGGTASVGAKVLRKRGQILSTLTVIFERDPESRVLFRQHGGFTWILSTLAGLGRALQEAPAAEWAEPVKFAARLLEILASSLSNCPSNQEYLQREIGISTLNDVLLSTRFFTKDAFVLPLVRSLIKVSVEGPWPPVGSAPVVLRYPEMLHVVVLLLLQHFFVLTNQVVVAAFQELCTLVQSCLELYSLSSKRTVHTILSFLLKPEILILLKDPQTAPEFSNMIELVVLLGSFNLMLPQVKQLFQLLLVVAPTLLDQICRVGMSSPRPRESLCFPWNSSSFVDFGPITTTEWPFAAGYSISFWINLAGARSGGDESIHVCAFIPPVIADMNSSSGSTTHHYHAVTVSEGHVSIWSSTSDCFVFSNVTLSPMQWHHVLLMHVPQKASDRKKRQNGQVKLVLDGVLRGSGQLAFGPSHFASPLSVRFGDQLASSSLWFLGNFMIFRGTLQDDEAASLFAAGCSFAGAFLSKSNKHMRQLHERRWLFFYPYRLACSIYALSEEQLDDAAERQMPQVFSPVLIQSAAVRHHAPLGLSLSSVCGVTSILYVIFSRIDHVESVANLITLLAHQSSKTHYPRNFEAMSRAHGWNVLAKILLVRRSLCHPRVLLAAWECCGLRQENGRLKGGKLEKDEPLQFLVLDWRLWCRGDSKFQKFYFETLFYILSEHDESEHNARIFGSLCEDLLACFDVSQDSPSVPPPSSLVPLVFRCFDLAWECAESNYDVLRLMADFLLLPLDVELPVSLVQPFHCPVHSSEFLTPRARPSMSPQSLRKQRSARDLNTSLDGSFSHPSAYYSLFISRLDAAEECLARLLSVAEKEAVRVMEVLPASFVVSLIRLFPRPTFREKAVALLTWYSSIGELDGTSWNLLSAVAAKCPPTNAAMVSLVQLTLGKTQFEESDVAKLLHAHPPGQPYKNPAGIVVLLRALSACGTDLAQGRRVIIGFHDSFLHSSSLQKQMIEAKVPIELCRLLASCSAHLQQSREESIATFVQDCLAFLKALVMFEVLDPTRGNVYSTFLGPVKELWDACNANSGVSMSSILALHGEIVCSILEFFSESAGKAAPLDQMSRTCSLVLESWVAKRDELAASVETWDHRILRASLKVGTLLTANLGQAAQFLSSLERCILIELRNSSSRDIKFQVVQEVASFGSLLGALCQNSASGGAALFVAVAEVAGEEETIWIVLGMLARIMKLDANGEQLSAASIGRVIEDFQLRVKSSVQVETDKKWKSQWMQDLQQLNAVNSGAVSTPAAKTSLNSDGLKATGLMERQLELQKPIMTRLQKWSIMDSKALRSWKRIVRGLTHERGVWPSNMPVKWKLDETEGPSRMRLRMKAVHPHPPSLAPEGEGKGGKLDSSMAFGGASALLDLRSGESIVFTCRCSVIHPYEKRPGEVVVTTQRSAFVDSVNPFETDSLDETSFLRRRKREDHVKRRRGKIELWPDEIVMDLQLRRYLLRDMALELFLTNGCTFLLAFHSKDDRDKVFQTITMRELPNRVHYQADVVLRGSLLQDSVTVKWQRGIMSSFEYLQHLNTLAGRSYNDLTQYPVFPWIVADYISAELDLAAGGSFRNLSRPMGAQTEARLEGFLEKYRALEDMGQKPYHYGSHYSNVGVVLHYLLRVEPFASFFLQFQGGHFDVADRLFDSVESSWRLASQGTTSDVKECIPEFFYFPNFLRNENGFDLGRKQSGDCVDHVHLPPWAKGSPRLFLRVMRDALESEYVSKHLPAWIDLIFGYKQNGEEARLACNLFHPLTYEGAVDVEAIRDPVERQAAIAQINSYGQVPRQLFTKPHPPRLQLPPIPQLLLHPASLEASLLWKSLRPVGSIALVHMSPVALGPKELLLFPDATSYFSWGEWDSTMRVCSLRSGGVLMDLEQSMDDIACAHSPSSGQIVAFGGVGGMVQVWSIQSEASKLRFKVLTELCGHDSAVQCLFVSDEFSIIVSGSSDGSCIIWDLNRLRFIRSMRTPGPVQFLAVSDVNGDIVVISSAATESAPSTRSVISLYSINGELLAENQTFTDLITSVAITKGTPGAAPRNLVVAGTSQGNLSIFDAWDLSWIVTLKSPASTSPIICLTLHDECEFVVSGSADGCVQQWICSSSSGSMTQISNLGI